jgi:hypothetical protein
LTRWKLSALTAKETIFAKEERKTAINNTIADHAKGFMAIIPDPALNSGSKRAENQSPFPPLRKCPQGVQTQPAIAHIFGLSGVTTPRNTLLIAIM